MAVHAFWHWTVTHLFTSWSLDWSWNGGRWFYSMDPWTRCWSRHLCSMIHLIFVVPIPAYSTSGACSSIVTQSDESIYGNGREKPPRRRFIPLSHNALESTVLDAIVTLPAPGDVRICTGNRPGSEALAFIATNQNYQIPCPTPINAIINSMVETSLMF